ncbi:MULTISPECIES: potassium channel family protein [Dietzia]|uniref:Trk system potassium uptake protein TrkA n=1 Tax=Dietzia cinnamea TaxID=321318 RepID=A0A4R3ZYJ4_9ACTN|nr:MULTISPECIES: TrkA family potassium uptake protein [Dietzia]EFV93596.1 TrkA-N domain protein [Dietzia cinnamea P4]PWD97179.1 TrkA family potassium uptake protein [Dietzia maris]MCT1711848.1 TrkA family potassium uptake protein [Dietzia cinnamea]MCT1864742.1 TrkA family potassium uptake protein [Dietzia cinnamea]MCT1885660.1 TrkA family potassium uptake protein [Dietzia cinnamea]
MADRTRRQSPVLIVGLGRFGISLATQLVGQGREVLAVERDHGLVQRYADSLTHVVEADATDIEALQQLGARDFSTAVVGVGTSIESSVLVAVNLVDLGINQVWAKAINQAHGKILTRIGCHHVVFPEHDAGVRVAHLVANQMMDFIEFDESFAIVKMRPPRDVIGHSIDYCHPRRRHKVNIVGIKTPGGPFQYAQPETIIGADDVIIVSGHVRDLERFADYSEQKR